MIDKKREEEVLNLFHESPIHKHLDLHLKFKDDNTAVVSMKPKHEHTHLLGATSGGVLCTILDVVGYCAASVSRPRGIVMGTADLTIHLLDWALKDCTLHAEGTVIKEGKTESVCDMKVWAWLPVVPGAGGLVEEKPKKLVAHGVGTFIVMQNKKSTYRVLELEEAAGTKTGIRADNNNSSSSSNNNNDNAIGFSKM